MAGLSRIAALGAGLLIGAAGVTAEADSDHGLGDHGLGDRGIKHVLLISIDGMHALDFINCANGISGVNGGAPYCPNLAQLAETGVDYLEASTSRPSDSFPGLMALVTGGSPRSVGAFYDVAYDRSLDPPAATTGNGVAGAPGLCTPGAPPTGTTTEFDEGIDIDQSQLNGGAPPGMDAGVASIDPKKLERDPARSCTPVYPWNFVRTNTIFGVVHKTGGYTAWSDKHPRIRPFRVPATAPMSTIIIRRRSTRHRWRWRGLTAAIRCRTRPQSPNRTPGPTAFRTFAATTA